ncbi:MAG: hypothetical protein ACR2FI_10390 [Burkholderiales bacterium]|nr:hypothetical protein [Burkholderiales bacterium]MDQ3195733.1 hypothetical protein [Pseudomonadota bacterium]
MDKDGSYLIALIGLPNHDMTLIKSLSKLSTARPRRYRVADVTERNRADIIMVNADDPFAVMEAKNMAKGNNAAQVYVVKQDKGQSFAPKLVQPINARHFFDAVDNLPV